MHSGAGKKKRSRLIVREQTQLQAVVEHLHHIAEESAYLLPRRLWLSVLPERLMLSELPDQKKEPQDFSVSVGLLDDPSDSDSCLCVWISCIMEDFSSLEEWEAERVRYYRQLYMG